MKKFKIYVFTLLCILSFEIFMTVRAAGNPYKSTGPYGINCTWYTWDKVKNIKGTIIVSNKLINKVPKGLNIVAFSLKITPIIVPTITEINIIIVDL